MANGHVEQQVLIAGKLLSAEQWSSLAVSLARDCLRETQALYELFEMNKRVPQDRIDKFLLTCELLHMLQPSTWSFGENVVISKDGKASLAVAYPHAYT